MKSPGINIDILIVKENKILLGLMTKQWNYEGKQVYGVPGRDIRFGEKIGDTLRRNIKEEFDTLIYETRLAVIFAQMRINIADIAIQALEKRTEKIAELEKANDQLKKQNELLQTAFDKLNQKLDLLLKVKPAR